MSSVYRRIAIAGAGISGLSAAYYIQRYCQEKAISAHITIIEPSEQLGGKIRTLHRDGCVIEQGPDSFLARKLSMLELARELGLEDELTATNPQAKKTYILHKHKLHRMPAGLMLGIPTQIMPFLRTGLISPLGKARAALDLLLPKKVNKGDEALGVFLSRRLGSEVLEHIAEPLLAGIYAGDTNELSLQSTFPQFQALEQEHRSIIIGMIRNKVKQHSQSAQSAQSAQSERSGQVPLSQLANRSMFLTFKQGLSTIVNRLAANLTEATIRKGIAVTEVSKDDGKYKLKLSDGSEELFDAVVLAVPNYAAVRMLPQLAEAHSLINIPYVSVANVVMAFRKSELVLAKDGSGFLVPRNEGLTITACTWTSVKWLHTAPDDTVLVRCYIGRSGAAQTVAYSDEQLTRRVRSDLKHTMGIEAEPLFVEVARWDDSMPQYPVGHLDQLKLFRQKLADVMPGVYMTGSGYQGVGLPDCIGQAKQCAEQVVDDLLGWS
ncbi:MAG: protoporphyrinogen oxidase [Paenibacillaceae bacterium]